MNNINTTSYIHKYRDAVIPLRQSISYYKIQEAAGLAALGTAAYFPGAGAPAGSSAFGAVAKTVVQIFSKGTTIAPAL